MINPKVFVKGLKSNLGVRSPTISLGACFIALGALLKDAGFNLQQSVASSFFTYALPGQLVMAESLLIGTSLLNIFKELNSDLNIPISKTGNLQPWANQGVLLLNTILTVEQDNANSHKDIGWEIFTKKVIEVISTKLNNIVFILWGKQANYINDIIDLSKHHIISSVHPSPLSAHRGFFGSKPFSKTNEFLKSKGVSPIDWNLN